MIVQLPSFVENVGSEMIRDLGIQVTALAPVSVYIHQYHESRSEATIVLPITSIGREYYVMSYEGVEQRGSSYESEFLIVGTEDETTVEIQVSDQTKGGKGAGGTFTILLDQGDTYQVQARNFNGDLTGSRITSDKKVAVFAGNKWTEVPIGCGLRDNLLEQMYAVDTWGKKFVTVPNDKVRFDVFRILGSVDGTRLL